MDPKQESIKKIFKKPPAAGGENFLIRYLGLGTSRLRYLRYPGAGRGGGTQIWFLKRLSKNPYMLSLFGELRNALKN